MKKVEPGKLEHGVILSEGKILEITPTLYMPDGTLTALPPTAYRCPNWLLGYEDYHAQNWAYNIIFNERASIQGTRSNWGVQVGFFVRVYEDSPGMVPNTIPTVPQEWAEMFAQAVKDVRKREPK